MTVMFLTMWEYTRDVEEDYRRFRPDKLPPEAAQERGTMSSPTRITLWTRRRWGGGLPQPYQQGRALCVRHDALSDHQ